MDRGEIKTIKTWGVAGGCKKKYLYQMANVFMIAGLCWFGWAVGSAIGDQFGTKSDSEETGAVLGALLGIAVGIYIFFFA